MKNVRNEALTVFIDKTIDNLCLLQNVSLT